MLSSSPRSSSGIPSVVLRDEDAHQSSSSAATPLTLEDLYILDPSPLGRGSYGEVTAATHHRTGARRAVKAVRKAGLQRYVGDVGGFVRREIDILRRLDHPNIVKLYEAFEDADGMYLVLELLDGGDLLERVTASKERLPEREIAA